MTDTQTIPESEHPLLAGRYRVVRRLGAGGMGEVFLVEDLKLDGRPFAVKMLPSFLAGNRRAMASLKREALHAMELSHPHIVTVRGFEETEAGQPFLVMDYIEGQTLEDLLVDEERLAEAEVVRLLGPIAEALDHAHTKGVVHRDVKPSNIMIRSDGTPVIMDFGVAREVKETSTLVTGAETASGTLPYMSPEQLRGERPTPAQDIYSLAATMWECLVGEPPFCRGDIRHQILHEQPRGIGGDADPLLQAAGVGLAKDAIARPKAAVGLFPGVSCEPDPAVGEPVSIAVSTPMPAPGSAADLLELESEARDAMRQLDAALDQSPEFKSGFRHHVVRAGDFLESARENKQARLFDAAAAALRKVLEECSAARDELVRQQEEDTVSRKRAKAEADAARERQKQAVAREASRAKGGQARRTGVGSEQIKQSGLRFCVSDLPARVRFGLSEVLWSLDAVTRGSREWARLERGPDDYLQWKMEDWGLRLEWRSRDSNLACDRTSVSFAREAVHDFLCRKRPDPKAWTGVPFVPEPFGPNLHREDQVPLPEPLPPELSATASTRRQIAPDSQLRAAPVSSASPWPMIILSVAMMGFVIVIVATVGKTVTTGTQYSEESFTGVGGFADFDLTAPLISDPFIRVDATLGVVTNRNSLPAGMDVQDGAIVLADGLDIPSKTSGTVNESLRVDKLYQLPGTRLVKLDVSRGKSPVNIWDELRAQAGEDAPVMLVDADGNTFVPVGWLHTQSSTDMINVKFDPLKVVPAVGAVPMLSTAGKDQLDLLYSIPVGRRIVAIKLGSDTIGRVDLSVEGPPATLQSQQSNSAIGHPGKEESGLRIAGVGSSTESTQGRQDSVEGTGIQVKVGVSSALDIEIPVGSLPPGVGVDESSASVLKKYEVRDARYAAICESWQSEGIRYSVAVVPPLGHRLIKVLVSQSDCESGLDPLSLRAEGYGAFYAPVGWIEDLGGLGAERCIMLTYSCRTNVVSGIGEPEYRPPEVEFPVEGDVTVLYVIPKLDRIKHVLAADEVVWTGSL